MKRRVGVSARRRVGASARPLCLCGEIPHVFSLSLNRLLTLCASVVKFL